ncbi:MAG: DUF4173 domain-containing protein [Oscillospiraceae bacterium]|nr:DUF4173 domain-containing protein [Oscillospiraceae bacterium]
MNERPYDTAYAAGAVPAEKPKTVYSRAERILAPVTMAAGFLFVRLALYHAAGVLTTLLFWGIITGSLMFLKKNGERFTAGQRLVIGVLYLFSVVYSITADPLLHVLDTLFLLLTGALLLVSVTSGLHAVLRFLPGAAARGVFAMPLMHFPAQFASLGSGVKGRGILRNIGFVLAGLVLAVPVTGICAALLCASDANMDAALGKLLSLPSDEVLVLIPHLAAGIVLGALLFSALYSAVHRSMILDEEESAGAVAGAGFLPPVMLLGATLPLCILYAVYIFTQMNYFLGGFFGELAAGYTYAEYARRGFFELCAVCCINLCVLGGTQLFARQKTLSLRIVSVYLGLCSLFQGGTAIAKMVMYVSAYGMTQLRVYTMWFMLLLMLLLLLVILRQFIRRLPIGAVSAAVFTVMFALLCFSRPDALMTRYNAERVLSGSLRAFDTSVLPGMSDDAWSVLCSYDPAQLTALSTMAYEDGEEGLGVQLHDREDTLDLWESLNLSGLLLHLYA